MNQSWARCSVSMRLISPLYYRSLYLPFVMSRFRHRFITCLTNLFILGEIFLSVVYVKLFCEIGLLPCTFCDKMSMTAIRPDFYPVLPIAKAPSCLHPGFFINFWCCNVCDQTNKLDESKGRIFWWCLLFTSIQSPSLREHARMIASNVYSHAHL